MSGSKYTEMIKGYERQVLLKLCNNLNKNVAEFDYFLMAVLKVTQLRISFNRYKLPISCCHATIVNIIKWSKNSLPVFWILKNVSNVFSEGTKTKTKTQNLLHLPSLQKSLKLMGIQRKI